MPGRCEVIEVCTGPRIQYEHLDLEVNACIQL